MSRLEHGRGQALSGTSGDLLHLDAVPLIDGHCHSVLAGFRESSVEAFGRLFTEAADPRQVLHHTPHSLTYRRALRDLAACLGCPATPEAILAARAGKSDYLAVLCRDAGLQGLLVDAGYPPESLSLPQLQAACGCRVAEVVRIETLAEDLLLAEASFAGFEARFRAALRGAKARGAVALKSIVAYRSGLAVRPVSPQEASETFQGLKRLAPQARRRLTAKPLLDYCVGLALEEAKRLELPLQFHTGFGDPDIDLLTANPALLRPLIDDPAYATVPIVLLHMGYPYVREAGFLASVYPQVYVDISLATPLLASRLPQLLHELLALTPATKILYGSDGHSQPEMFWLGARYARWALTAVLQRAIAEGFLTAPEARDMAECMCYRNAAALYRLPPGWASEGDPGGSVHPTAAQSG
jgi:hypothetical protein